MMMDILKRVKGGFISMIFVVSTVTIVLGYCWIAAELWLIYGAIVLIIAIILAALGLSWLLGGENDKWD